MPIEGPVRVLVVDDHAGIRHGIANLIDAERPHMLSVGAAATVDEALAQTREQQPDVVVLDVNLGGEDGLALIPRCSMPLPARSSYSRAWSTRMSQRTLGGWGRAPACTKTAPAAELLACILAARRAEEIAVTATPRTREALGPVPRGANTHRPWATPTMPTTARLPRVGSMNRTAQPTAPRTAMLSACNALGRLAARVQCEDDSATAIECGLIAGLITTLCTAAFQATGTSFAAMYTTGAMPFSGAVRTDGQGFEGFSPASGFPNTH